MNKFGSYAVVLLLLSLAVFLLAPAAGGQAPGPVTRNEAGTDIVIGRSTTFKSTLLNRTITLDVALPAGYATGRDRPPFRTRILKGSHLAP